MAAVKHEVLTSQEHEDGLFAALLHVLQQGDYDVAGVSNEQKETMFTSGKTAFSWGHIYAATVKGDGSGSVLQLTVGTIPGAPWSLTDGRKNQKAATTLIETVEAALAAPTPPQPAPVESFAKLQDGSIVPWTEGEFPED